MITKFVRWIGPSDVMFSKHSSTCKRRYQNPEDNCVYVCVCGGGGKGVEGRWGGSRSNIFINAARQYQHTRSKLNKPLHC